MEPNNNSKMEEGGEKNWAGETYTCHICFRVFRDKKALIFHVALHRRAKVIPINGVRHQQQKLQPTIIRPPPQQIRYVLVRPQGSAQINYQPQQQQHQEGLLLNQNNQKPNFVSGNNNNVGGGDFNLKIINTVSLAEKQKEAIKNQMKQKEGQKDPLAFIAPASKINNGSVIRTLNMVNTSVSPVKKGRTTITPVKNPLNHVQKTKTNTKKNWFEEILKLSRNSDKLPNFGILCPDVEIDIDPQEDEEEQEPTFEQVNQYRGNSSMEKDTHNKKKEENKGGVPRVMEMEEEEDPITQIISKLIENKLRKPSTQQSPNLPSFSSSASSSSSLFQKKVASPKEIINKKPPQQQQQKQPIKQEKINALNDVKQIGSEEIDSKRRTKTRIIKKPMKLAEFFSSDFVTNDELEGIRIKKKSKSPTKNADISFKRSPSIGVVACPYPNCVRKFSTRGNMIRHTRLNHRAP